MRQAFWAVAVTAVLACCGGSQSGTDPAFAVELELNTHKDIIDELKQVFSAAGCDLDTDTTEDTTRLFFARCKEGDILMAQGRTILLENESGISVGCPELSHDQCSTLFYRVAGELMKQWIK